MGCGLPVDGIRSGEKRMRCSSTTNPYGKMYDIAIPSYGTAGKNVSSNLLKETGGSRNCDVVDISADWAKEAQDFLEQMKQEYRGVHIRIQDPSDPFCGSSVAQMAEDLGNGTYLIVSRDFLERMGSSREDYLACRNVMESILRQLLRDSGKNLANGAVLGEHTASYWSVPVPEIQPPAFPSKSVQSGPDYGIPDTGLQSDIKMKAGSSACSSAFSYARLAGASTKGQVRTVMGEAHRSIASLRMVIALGDDREKAKARAAVGSLQKLLVRGSKKLKKLDEETLLKIRRNRAKKQRHMKKARRFKQELQKKRSVRYTFDSALRTEGLLDEANRKWQFYDDKDQETVPYGAAGMDMIPGGGTAAGMGDGAFTAADVAVSEPVSF